MTTNMLNNEYVLQGIWQNQDWNDLISSKTVIMWEIQMYIPIKMTVLQLIIY